MEIKSFGSFNFLINVMNEEKIGFVLAKARNLVYYVSIDTRPRATYIHAVRELREEMKSILGDLVGTDLYNILLDIIRSCPKKITAEQCKPWIIGTLKQKLEEYGIAE